MHEVLARAICQIRTTYLARLFRTEDHTSPVLSANSIWQVVPEPGAEVSGGKN